MIETEYGIYIYLPVIMFVMLFTFMSGQTEKKIKAEHYTVHGSRRFLAFGILGILAGSFMAIWALLSEEKIGAGLLAGVLAVLWGPGFGFTMYYCNRKIIVSQDQVIFQNIWGRKKRYQLEDLRADTRNTAASSGLFWAREITVTTKDGKKAFEFEKNMVNASCLIEQLRKQHMERLNRSVKNLG